MDGYIGEIKMFVGTFAPYCWLFCEGQTLPINDYSALFNLIGTTYGGDGISNFKLPDLRGRVVLGAGTGQGLSTRKPADKGGVENVTLALAEMPSHSHTVKCDSTSVEANLSNSPLNSLPATLTGEAKGYGTNETNNPMMKSDMLSISGSNQPHDNMPPWGCIHYIICFEGIWPPRP